MKIKKIKFANSYEFHLEAMKRIPFNLQKTVVIAMITTLQGASCVHAQESVNNDLDACVKNEQITLTAKGAGIGALAGLGSVLFSNNKKDSDDAIKKAAIGAAVGAAAGFATAYFNAVDTCFKKNPSWIPESNIERSQDYEQAKKASNYRPAEGIKVQALNTHVAGSMKAGNTAEIISTFRVLTPDGAETPVTIERKLSAVVDGKETPLTFPGKTSESRVVQPGELKDLAHLPLPAKAKAGTQYIYEFSVSTPNKPTSMTKAIVTVE